MPTAKKAAESADAPAVETAVVILPDPPKDSLCNSCVFYDAEHSCWRLQQLKDAHNGAMPHVRDCPDYSPLPKES